jgi:hypothetical protein
VDGPKVSKHGPFAELSSPGDYTIKFSKKFIGKKVGEISNKEHLEFIEAIREHEKVKPLTKDAAEYLFYAEQWLEMNR